MCGDYIILKSVCDIFVYMFGSQSYFMANIRKRCYLILVKDWHRIFGFGGWRVS